MLHCIVVMFVNAEKSAINTGWMTDPMAARYKIMKEKELSRARIAWIGWSYYYRHKMADLIIENQLRDLAKSLTSIYQDTVVKRKLVRDLYGKVFKNPVYVLHKEITEDEVCGFAYAQCVWRGAPADDSDTIQVGSNSEGALAL